MNYTLLTLLLIIYIALAQSGNNELLKKHKGIANFFAGGLAGTISSSLTIPLEVVKTQLQSSAFQSKGVAEICKTIYDKDGIKGFFRGLRPLLVGIIPARAIYFYSYKVSKEHLATECKLGNSPINHLCSAFVAGITSNTITNPIWMVRTRYQLFADPTTGQRMYKSYWDVVKSVWREEGPLGYWKGLTASIVGCTEGAIQWMVYEDLKKRMQATNDDKSSSSSSSSSTSLFLAAAFSKGTAICLTYPHEVVRTRLREQASNGVFKYTGFLQTLQRIGREEGIRGLYGGLGMHLVRSVPNAAIMFLSYELVSSYIDRQVALAEAVTTATSPMTASSSNSRTASVASTAMRIQRLVMVKGK